MKKIIYGLGAIASIVTPVVAVVSCGPSSNTNETMEAFTQDKLDKWVEAKGKEFGWSEGFKNLAKQCVDFRKASNTIKENAFFQTHIPEGFTLPDEIEYIGSQAFEGSTLPKSFKMTNVTWINENAFRDSTFLGDVSLPKISHMEPGGMQNNFENGVFENAKLNSVHFGTKDFEIEQFSFASATINGDFEIPAGTKRIFQSTFYKTQFTKPFLIPSSVKEIDNAAFSEASLPLNFNLSEGLESIDYYAFGKTKLPLGFKIPSSVKNIELSAFNDCILPANTHWSLGSPKAGSEVVHD